MHDRPRQLTRARVNVIDTALHAPAVGLAIPRMRTATIYLDAATRGPAASLIASMQMRVSAWSRRW